MAARDGVRWLSLQDPLDRHLELLAGQRPRDRGHRDDLVRDMPRRKLAPKRGRDPCPRGRIDHGSRGGNHEQQQLAYPTLRPAFAAGTISGGLRRSRVPRRCRQDPPPDPANRGCILARADTRGGKHGKRYGSSQCSLYTRDRCLRQARHEQIKRLPVATSKSGFRGECKASTLAAPALVARRSRPARCGPWIEPSLRPMGSAEWRHDAPRWLVRRLTWVTREIALGCG